MTRKLTEDEIENMLDFIQPQEDIPYDTAMSVVIMNKNCLRKQLVDQLVYPEIIPDLKQELFRQYRTSLVQNGESVGVICAQSMGEKQTQTTLNSVDWADILMYMRGDNIVVEPIGQMIDGILKMSPDSITRIQENRTEYLSLPEGYMVPSCDENGLVNWYRIEAVTRHLPVGKLVKVTTQSGRRVTATQSKSFLVWNGDKFEGVSGIDVKVGDILPTTSYLRKPGIAHEYFDLETIFPKDKYLYTSEIVKARDHRFSHGWSSRNGIDFTLPYTRPEQVYGRRKDYFLTCKPGLVYIHTSSVFVSRIPEKIPLDNDFGFLIGLYLVEGWCTNTFVGISNNDNANRKRVTDYCDRYGITYNLVTSSGKSAMKGVGNDLKIHSTLLARLIKILCDTGSADKHVPEFAYTAPEEFIKGLVDGYYSGEGTIFFADGSVVVSSESEDLISGLSTLLSYFGIFGVMRRWHENNNVGKNITRTYILRVSNGFAQQFSKEILLTRSTKQEGQHSITLSQDYMHKTVKSQEMFPDRDVYFDKVVSVEHVEGTTEYVYDLTVEVTRNFQLWNGLNCRDTFHTAGQSQKTMTSGVPRFQELINATKKPRIVNNTIYFNGGNSTIQDIRHTVGHSITGLRISDVAKSIIVEMNKEDEPWYDAHKILFDDTFSNYEHCISVKMNMNVLYEYKLSLQNIADVIEKEYDDLYCVFSPLQRGQLDIFVDTSNIILPKDRIAFIDQENAVKVYMEEVVQTQLSKMYICGIPAITDVFYSKKGEEWIVETNGYNSKNISKSYSSFKKLLAHPDVDYTRTISNNVWDIYEVLDIEAARQFLIEEFMGIMDGINVCHTMFLVDRMTHGGTIASISRHTLKAGESGPMGKASFEETMDNFLNAGAQGQQEPTRGVSASIICGKRAAIGTNKTKVIVDISRLPKAVPIEGDIKAQAIERVMKQRSRTRKQGSKKSKVPKFEQLNDEEDCVPNFVEI